jgi:maltooligosyltrehalose trehalohydrolase
MVMVRLNEMADYSQIQLGAKYRPDRGTRFLLWAPLVETVDVHLVGNDGRHVPMKKDEHGYHELTDGSVKLGAQYTYTLNGRFDRPDPASRYQPQGVHGPSQVIGSDFLWKDAGWRGLPLGQLAIYELHVGTFTNEGTFEAIIPHLAELRDLGITALELMPVAQFPGKRNWGYDGVYPFAVQNSYGGPVALKTLVNACHEQGLAAILDVVYNHLGPEGNYFAAFAPYFTERYKTAWGPAVNFDAADSDHVRRYFIENALYWVTEFHFDALRLDAVHAILDHSPYTFLEELTDEIHHQAKRLNRQIYLIPESAANDARLIRERDRGGYGCDAQWNDDFHHALRGVLTGEKSGYYQDYGEFHQLVKAYREGFVYSGEYSKYRRRRHGTPSRDIPAHRFVVFSQNHDQVGNRMLGERLTQLVSFEKLKLAAGAVLLSPFIPLLFMGEEYGEEAPFLYFIDHGDPELVQAVRDGRRREFAAFDWQGSPPDPQNEATFLRAKLNHELRQNGGHRTLWEFYRELFRLRKELTPLRQLSKDRSDVIELGEDRVLFLSRWSDDQEVITVFNFNGSLRSPLLPFKRGTWIRAFDSADTRWQGAGSILPSELKAEGAVTLTLKPLSFAVFTQYRKTQTVSHSGAGR